MDSTDISPEFNRCVRSVLDSNLDDEKILSALKNMYAAIVNNRNKSTFYDQNNLLDQRKLLGNLECHSSNISRIFLNKYCEINSELQSIQSDIENMLQTCKSMEIRIENTKKANKDFLERAEDLLVEEKSTAAKLDICKVFLEKFQLDDESIAIIDNSSVDQSLFEVLKKVLNINRDCEVLLRSQSIQQKTCLEIMDLTQKYLEAIYRKLYRWIKSECKKLGSLESPTISNLFTKTLEVLDERAVLLNYCLIQFSRSRAQAINSFFVQALLEGRSSDFSNPIDFYCYDPRRYVGDIAAWINQALTGEVELVQDIITKLKPSSFLKMSKINKLHPFKSENNPDQSVESITDLIYYPLDRIDNTTLDNNNLDNSYSEFYYSDYYTYKSDYESTSNSSSNENHIMISSGSTERNPSTTDPISCNFNSFFDRQSWKDNEIKKYAEFYYTKILEIITGGFLEPFGDRIERVINSMASPIILYHLSNTFRFYVRQFKKILKVKIPLISIFIKYQKLSMEKFFKVIDNEIGILKSQPPSPGPDYSAPIKFMQIIKTIKDLLKTFETSLPTDLDQISIILNSIIDPLMEVFSDNLEYFESIHDKTSKVLHNIHTIYLINLYKILLNTLAPYYGFCKTKIEQIKVLIDAKIDNLAMEQSATILRACGLSSKVLLLDTIIPEPNQLSKMNGMEPFSLIQCFKTFEMYLFDVKTLLIPNIGSLEEDLQNKVLKKVSLQIKSAYSKLYNAVIDPKNGYEKIESFLKYKPEQIEEIINKS